MWNATLLGVWQPLTWFLTAVEYVALGRPDMNTPAGLARFSAGIHAVSVALHALASAVCFFVARQLLRHAMPERAARGPAGLDVAALLTALLFGLHPFRTEVVAWASGQPYVFAMVFALTCIWAYIHAVEQPTTAGYLAWYIVAAAMLALSVLCKAMAVPMVAVLFVLDFYPLRRFERLTDWPRLSRVLAEKIPLALITLAVAYRTIHATTSTKNYAADSINEKYLVACFCIWFYVLVTFIPVGIAPYYMKPLPFNSLDPLFILAGLAVPIFTVFCLVQWRRRPWLLAAWAACVLVLLPVIGLVQHGGQMAADRYTYLSCIPWALLIGGAALRFWDSGAAASSGLSGARVVILGAGAAASLGLGVMSWRQAAVWHDTVSTWTAMVVRNPDFHMGFYNLAAAYNRNGNVDMAVKMYEEAIRLNPLYPEALVNLGNIHRRRGDSERAVAYYLTALQGRKNFHMALMNLADVLGGMGRCAEARQYLATALEEALHSNERDDREQRAPQIEQRLRFIEKHCVDRPQPASRSVAVPRPARP